MLVRNVKEISIVVLPGAPGLRYDRHLRQIELSHSIKANPLRYA